MAENLELLLKAGADPNSKNWSGERIMKNLSGKTGTTETMKILLTAGVDVMERDKDNDMTPLHAAIFADDAEKK